MLNMTFMCAYYAGVRQMSKKNSLPHSNKHILGVETMSMKHMQDMWKWSQSGSAPPLRCIKFYK